MAQPASQRWENGRMVERAIETNRGNASQREEMEAAATKPYKAPLRTPRSSEDREAYQSERAQVTEKAVEGDAAENKAVSSTTTKAKRTRKK